MIHIYYLFIITLSVIISSVLTSSLPLLKRKWNAFKMRKKQKKINTSYLVCKIEDLEERLNKKEQVRKAKIEAIVLDYLKELQK